MEPKREVAVWPNASRTVSAGGASIANSPTNSPQRRKGQATTMVTSPPVKRVKKPVHPLTNKPSFVYIRPRLNKDRSLRRAVVERKLLTNNGLIAHDTPTQILRKTSNRAYNPHRPMIVHEGRKRSSGGGEGGSGSGANVVNGLALPPPMISSGVEGHIGRGHHGPVAQAATTSPSGQATSVLGTNAQSGKSTNYAVATPRSMGDIDVVDSPPPQRLVHGSTLAARAQAPQSSRVGGGGGVSIRDTSHQWTRNTFLVRKKTLRQISEDTKEKAAPSARVAAPGTTRKKIKPSVASTSKAPPAPKPLLNVGLSLQKMEPYTPESKLSSSSSSAKSDGPVVHGGSSSSGRNVSTQNAMLARGNPASLRKPPRASEAVGTSTAASSLAVPRKHATNPVLRRQDTMMLIEQARESDAKSDSGDNEEGGHRDDDKEGVHSNNSDSEEGEYDEIATFNDFFPDDKIELPASVANFKFTQIYSMTPPEGFTGTQAEWLETMYEGLSEEVEVLKTLALHTQTHASNAHTETLLAEKELRQVTKLVEALESGLRERGGEECWESYQEALAAAEEDSSEEEDPLPEPLEMEEEDSLSEPLDMEVDFEDELRRNPKNRIIPREAGGNREYIVTPPLSDDEVDDAHSESPVPSSHSNDENRAPVDPSSPTTSPILSSRANVPGHIIKDARADVASAPVHGCKRTREEDSPDNDDSHIIYRKNENNDETKGLVRKDPRPVVKRMRVPFSSSSSSSGKDIKELEDGASTTNQEKTSCARTFGEGTRTGPSSTLEPGSSVGAQADVQAARPIKPLPAPRIIRTAIAMARSLFSSSSKPIAEVEVIDVDMLPSPKRPVPPKIQTRPPVTEHEVIDVDAYELTGNVSMGQAGPSTRPQRQADLGTTVVIPRRRTITPRSVRHPRVFARRSVGRGSANARAGGSRSGLTSGERVVRGVVSASVPGAVTVREKVEKWLRRTSIDILEQLEFRGRS
ncbi:hypothetical protein BDY19DRAFT_9432 [Irpex rosettiformis]|uniref:Uncharacterized protein n=1 Tax=Irpex rosettiformis TaxID=378272 RepID=A0ACB8UJK8_9APHY|nr:hypothetical protein BDY19DRAFT_9432 [Irpex rosettiformis]